MKRSEINNIIRQAKVFLQERRFLLPEWSDWSPNEWKGRYDICKEVVDNMLGWDITDFGSGDFKSKGLFLFTIRNGNLVAGGKTYAEKIMIVRENQETHIHFHWTKTEDIINRGGGNLAIELYMADKQEKLSDEPVRFKIDGIARICEAGGTVFLKPGESICLEPYMSHRFYGAPGTGTVLVGEVSSVNDDTTDNCFLDGVGRFPAIEEDEPPIHLLVSDYPKYL